MLQPGREVNVDSKDWIDASRPFLGYVDQWSRGLPRLAIDQAFASPGQVAIVSVDVINGFCNEGPLASPRVRALIPHIVALFERAWAQGIRQIVLTQDTHEPDAIEFGQFPPHCVRGTAESETVSEFKALPFFDRMTVFPKNSIQSGLNTGLNDWVAGHPAISTYIVVGDCTDLCTHQLAMHLRLDANARQLQRRVVVPADCVDTYDLPVEVASSIGAVPHDAELLHRLFLYSLMLNGVEVVAALV